jgi:hypothetical protein
VWIQVIRRRNALRRRCASWLPSTFTSKKSVWAYTSYSLFTESLPYFLRTLSLTSVLSEMLNAINSLGHSSCISMNILGTIAVGSRGKAPFFSVPYIQLFTFQKLYLCFLYTRKYRERIIMNWDDKIIKNSNIKCTFKWRSSFEWCP